MRCDRLKEQVKACHYLHCQQKKMCMSKSFEARTVAPFKRASKREPSPSNVTPKGRKKK